MLYPTILYAVRQMSTLLEVFISVNGFEQLHQLADTDENAETRSIVKRWLHPRFYMVFRIPNLFDVPN